MPSAAMGTIPRHRRFYSKPVRPADNWGGSDWASGYHYLSVSEFKLEVSTTGTVCADVEQRRGDRLMFRTVVATGVFVLLMGAPLIALSIAPSTLAANAQSSGPETEKLSTAAASAMDKLPYPAGVSLIHRRSGWLFRGSPNNLRLYVFDKDTAEKSGCDFGCASAWPPLRPRKDAKPLGDWTIFTRDDGTKQWAYQGRQAYFRYHDSPGNPTGNGVDGLWHFLVPSSTLPGS
jgi:predicted lipoprotein with Yx(FWY)xxD motif